jgi:serine/threonine-protein phosphatase 2A activator
MSQEGESILKDMLPASHYVLIPFLLPYLLTSFGSFTRLDYGTGHEASFALFLLSLALARFFPVGGDGSIERSIVLRVFTRYLRLCFRLQDDYRLEPAGSHGVWGLDDHQFLGYVFGSAQLRGQHVLMSCCKY